MALFTHWACFDCRKSFHNPPNNGSLKCPECGKQIIDMGIYFEPPRKQAKKKWEVMRFLAENGYKFQTEGEKVYIEKFILGAKNSRLLSVKETVDAENKARLENKQRQRIKFFKESKKTL